MINSVNDVNKMNGIQIYYIENDRKNKWPLYAVVMLLALILMMIIWQICIIYVYKYIDYSLIMTMQCMILFVVIIFIICHQVWEVKYDTFEKNVLLNYGVVLFLLIALIMWINECNLLYIVILNFIVFLFYVVVMVLMIISLMIND